MLGHKMSKTPQNMAKPDDLPARRERPYRNTTGKYFKAYLLNNRNLYRHMRR
jgi:hypothetical protein